MSVIIEPAEQLEFHRPFTRISKESLHVKNPGTEAVIFKVKTTAPKQYCVRPNAGRIEPNSEIEVQIILQPFKDELPDDYKCKDKFLVQTAPINESFEQQDISSMWSHVEGELKASIHQHKIKCVFVGPREEEENDIVSPIPEPVTTADIASSSPSSSTIPPIVAEPTTSKTETTIESPTLPTAPTVIQQQPSVTVSPPPVIEQPKPRSVVAAVTPQVQSAVVVKKEEEKEEDTIKKELKEALQKIKQLEQQLMEAEKENVRSRSNNGGGRKLPATVQPLDAVHQHLAALEKPHPIEGYPPQVVFAVAALVFIFTYLFF